MVAFPLNKKLRRSFSALLQDPVLNQLISDYSFDNKYVYIPKDAINNKNPLTKLISENKLTDTSR